MSAKKLLVGTLCVALLSTLWALVPTTREAAAVDVLPRPPGAGSGGSVNNPGNRGSIGSGNDRITYDCSRHPGAFFRGRLLYGVWPGCRTPLGWGGTATGYWQFTSRRLPNPAESSPEQRNACTHTYELWRFYGTRSNPVQGYTVRRINIDPVCDGHRTRLTHSVPAIQHEVHPEDSAARPIMGVVAPWRAGVTNQETGWPMSLTGINGTLGRGFVAASNWPFRRGSARCDQLHSRDPNRRQYFQGGNMFNTPYGQQMRNIQIDLFNRLNRALGGEWGNQIMDRTGTVQGQPVFGDNGMPCSGLYDFSVGAQANVQPANQGNVRIFGACAIPVWREHRLFTASTTGDRWWVPIAPNVAPGQGTPEIYSHYYGPEHGGSRNTVGGSYGRSAAGRAVIDRYRTAIADEVFSRPWSGARTPGMFPDDQTRPPHASYNYANRTSDSNLFNASFVAAVRSRCVSELGPMHGDPSQTTGSTTEQMPGDAVRVIIDLPEAGQVGGANRPATTIRTSLASGANPHSARNPTTSEVRCGNAWCPVRGSRGPLVQSVTLRGLGLTPPQGGDYRVRSQTNPTRGNANPWLSLEFYKPTEGDQRYQVRWDNPTAVIRGRVGTNQTITICDPSFIGGSCRTHTVSTEREVTRTVPVQIICRFPGGRTTTSMSECGFPVVSATATPIEGRGGS